jgi:hypothetical protein
MIATERVAGAEAFIAKYRDTPPPIYFGWMGVTVASTQERLPTYEAIVALLKRP